MRAEQRLRVDLRPFEERDLPRLASWARHIDAGAYMSRTRPLDDTLVSHDPATGVLWYVIRVDDRDVGAIWLEREAESSCSRLGILLGDEALFGRGIGTEAVSMVIERARAGDRRIRTLALHVRRGNERAIACYEKCGFVTVESGRKLRPDGTAIEFYRMERRLDR
jgi:RimJ/RimL family protein N-acetyltransferase